MLDRTKRALIDSLDDDPLTPDDLWYYYYPIDVVNQAESVKIYDITEALLLEDLVNADDEFSTGVSALV